MWLKIALNAVRLPKLNRLTGNRGRAHWLASSLKLAARCPVLLVILYNHIKTICAIIQRLFGQNEVIAGFDGCT